MAAVLSFNAQAADEKAKKPKGKGAYAKMVATLKLTAEQKPKFQALQKEQNEFMAEQKKRSAEEKKEAAAEKKPADAKPEEPKKDAK